MSEWKRTKVGDVITLHYGKALKENVREKGNVPVYSSAGHTGFHNQSLTSTDGIIVGRKGSIGKVYYSDIPFWCIDTAYYILPDPATYNLRYVFYLLKTLKLEELNEDSAVPGLNRETAYSQEILLPPLQEQEAIAEILSSLDNKIDLLHRNNKTLEKLADTLFRQWFVVEANDSWEDRRLNDLLTISSSKRIFYSEYTLTGVPFYRSKEIIELNKAGAVTNELFISEQKYKEIEAKYGAPQEGDILLTSVGTLGIPYRVTKKDRFYFKDGNLTWFKKFTGIPSSVLYVWLTSSEGKTALNNITIGSTQPALTIDGLRNITIAVPEAYKLVSYGQTFDQLLSKIESNQSQIRLLTQLQNVILPKLMNGTVRVSRKSYDKKILSPALDAPYIKTTENVLATIE